MLCSGRGKVLCTVANVTRPSGSSAVIRCSHSQMCVFIHLVLHSSTLSTSLLPVSFLILFIQLSLQALISLHNFTSEIRHLCLFISKSINARPSVHTSRFPHHLLNPLFTPFLHPPSPHCPLLPPLSLHPLDGKSRDFFEAGPYKPAALGGLFVCAGLWLVLAFRSCFAHTHRHRHTLQTPCFLLPGTNVIVCVRQKIDKQGS